MRRCFAPRSLCCFLLLGLLVSTSSWSNDLCSGATNSALDELATSVNGADLALRTSQGLGWCAPFRVGETRAVDLSWNQSPTGVEMRYNLERTTADTYTASVALNYVPDANPQNAPSVSSAAMLEQTRRCLETISSQFETPSGQKLRINVLSPAQAQSDRFTDATRPPVVDVNLGRTGGNARSHGESMECATRAHEILHLMGLVDEYDHTTGNSGGNPADLSCKPVARSANIMTNNTTSALNSFGASHRRRERLCVCKDDAASCRMAVSRNNEALYYYMYARFSVAQASRLGYRCQLGEATAAGAVALTASSVVPRPTLTATQAGFVARSYEFREATSTLAPVEITCQCTDPTKCRVSGSNFLDTLYRVDTNSCPADMTDNNGFFSTYALSGAQDFGASRIQRNPHRPNSIGFAVNKPFDGLKEYQLKRIIDGGCQGIRNSYTQCSSYASRVWAGTENDSDCSQRPRNCYEEE